ncbi:SDR family NAD(P)-dependent oxidoreductase [Desulfoluna spongiiphila]|uniref:SDR family NAD(P)-dependent oxidoreductase n=1 Tax=Desulfoluna spongiiphila TaxID=419481 RepID=UPI0012537023|nr:SDR family NAD(P)-dependent oxidoreductase [Desulfoluna spongiiphila]VVS95663.1 short-chain dehydrogenase/reductase sdr [Desulfoluna spongiiphila]
MDWKGITVYVTGGSSGIGLETARQLFDKGARVALFARGEQALTAVAEAFSARSDQPEVFSLPMDVSDWADVHRKIGTTVTTFGAPDVVVNCAGVGIADHFENIDAEAFDKVLAINVSGSRNVAAATVPWLKKNKGALVLIASSAGFIPVFGYSAYSTSKFAVMGFAEVLRCELTRFGVQVSLFCPSEVDTPMLEREKPTIPKETRALKDFAGVLPVGVAAEKLIRGIEKGRFLIVPGVRTKLLYWVRRLVPGPLYRFGADFTAMVGATKGS